MRKPDGRCGCGSVTVSCRAIAVGCHAVAVSSHATSHVIHAAIHVRHHLAVVPSHTDNRYARGCGSDNDVSVDHPSERRHAGSPGCAMVLNPSPAALETTTALTNGEATTSLIMLICALSSGKPTKLLAGAEANGGYATRAQSVTRQIQGCGA